MKFNIITKRAVAVEYIFRGFYMGYTSGSVLEAIKQGGNAARNIINPNWKRISANRLSLS